MEPVILSVEPGKACKLNIGKTIWIDACYNELHELIWFSQIGPSNT